MQLKARRGHHGLAAFTLLELVFVLLLVTIIIAIVVPSLSRTARGREQGDTAAHIVVLCNYARSQAIAEGRPYRLNFDENGAGYWLTAQEDGQFGDLGTDFGQQFKITAGLRVETNLPRQNDGTYVTFKQDGRVDPAPVTVRVLDDANHATAVQCESTTELFHVVVP